MHDDTATEIAPRLMRSAWMDENARGLALASDGEWSQAEACFSAAAEALSEHTDVAAHEALALVLNNLAHAFFFSGRIDEALRHAQRACSLRAALVGDDAISTARARADLAVMLASAGRTSEALPLIRRAIASVERNLGDEDPQLIGLLESAARLALADGQPSTAEPYLLRLHALLDAFEMPTTSAEVLLTRVAHARSAQARVVRVPTPVVAEVILPSPSIELDSSLPTFGANVVGLDIELVEDLGATIDVSDDLDPATPSETEHPSLDADEPYRVGAEARLDIFGDASFDLVEAPAPSAAPTPATMVSAHGLGFTVEYGVTSTGPAPDPSDVIIPPPTSSRILTPYESMPATLPPVASPEPSVAPPAAPTPESTATVTSGAAKGAPTAPPPSPATSSGGESSIARRFRRWSLRT